MQYPLSLPMPLPLSLPMSTTSRPQRWPGLLKTMCTVGLLTGASLLSGTALAADGSHVTKATSQAAQGVQAQFAKDRAACMAGKTGQDQAACLREAGAARDEAMKGVLNNDGADTAAMQRNALERCKLQPAADQASCRERITGPSTTSGSVQGGGILRELVETEPGKPAQTAEPARTK